MSFIKGWLQKRNTRDREEVGDYSPASFFRCREKILSSQEFKKSDNRSAIISAVMNLYSFLEASAGKVQ